MTVPDHDAYIAATPERFRPVLTALRDRVAGVLPDAEEVVKYGMPGFRVEGQIVASHAAFSRACGPYVSASAISARAEDIAAAGLSASKTGITSTPTRTVPADLVERLVLASRKEVGQ